MGSMLFRDPQSRSSTLAMLGTLQPRAFRTLNRVDPLDSISNYHIKLTEQLKSFGKHSMAYIIHTYMHTQSS